MATQRKAKTARGLPKRTGKRKAKLTAYFEIRYPEKKLLRMYRAGATPSEMKKWAYDYKCPSGVSGVGALIKIGKRFNLNFGESVA